jgi:hypothetical protein
MPNSTAGKNIAKIAEFTARGRDELAALANDNQPPEKAKRVSRLMDIVLDPAHHAPGDFDADRRLNHAERCAIQTLIDYEADEFGVFSRLITLAVEIAFEVDSLAALRAAQFDVVIRYLVHILDRCWS